MSITDDKLHKESAAELKVLEGLIDYTDRMFNEGNRSEYAPVRRHAYGKTVVIETEKAGVQTFRLGYAPAVYPNAASGYATPHSPVGRLCSYLRPGDEAETPRWGEYRVREIRLFDRFQGLEFEPNLRNFLSMQVETESDRAKVVNLRATLSGVRNPSTKSAPPAHEPSSSSLNEISESSSEAHESSEAIEQDPVPATPAFVISTFTVIEDEEHDAPIELDEDEVTGSHVGQVEQDYYGLSETFFVNRTRQQDEVISRSPEGPMFVHGVAGSGKTSAALGRTKMLCDFNGQGLPSEAEFREIAGHSLDYWSSRFAGKFSQEGSVGFVRTGELIQYLKETCRRLDLSHLPVQEYPELRSRLRVHRKLDRHRPGRGRWAGLSEPRASHLDTTMAWLRAADAALAQYWSVTLPQRLPTEKSLTSVFAPGMQTKVQRVARMALRALQAHVQELANELAQPVRHGFALDKLAARVTEKIELVRKEILGKDVLWVSHGEQSWVSRSEQDMAKSLVQAKVPLLIKPGIRLVFVQGSELVDPSLQLLNRAGEALEWSEDVSISLNKGELLARDAAGGVCPAKASSINDLYLRLLPEAIERPYVLGADSKLRPLSIMRGLGRERLDLEPDAQTQAGQAQDDEVVTEDLDAIDAAEEVNKRRSIDAQFNSVARRALMQALAYLADAYADTIMEVPSAFPDEDLASQIAQQLNARKLTDADIDLLLCLAHVVGRSFTGTPSALSEPPYFQAVFIDEVQDFTEQQVYLMSEQANPEHHAVTVVGDVAQKLHNGSTINVAACFPGKSLPVVELTDNLRQLEAPGLAWFSACFRATLQDGLPEFRPSGVLAERLKENGHQLRGPEFLLVDDDADMVEQIVAALKAVKHTQTAAILLPDAATAAACHALCKAELAAHMIDAELSEKIDLSRRYVRHFTAVANAKGLEFDVVLVPQIERYRLDDGVHLNRLYVGLTRARRKLVLLSSSDRPESKFDHVWRQYEDALTAV